jgi:hypothetical protein
LVNQDEEKAKKYKDIFTIVVGNNIIFTITILTGIYFAAPPLITLTNSAFNLVIHASEKGIETGASTVVKNLLKSFGIK